MNTKPDRGDLELWRDTLLVQQRQAERAQIADVAASYARGVRFVDAWLQGMRRPAAEPPQEGAYGLGERGG